MFASLSHSLTCDGKRLLHRVCAITRLRNIHEAFVLCYFSVLWDYRAWLTMFSLLSQTVRYGNSTRHSNTRSKACNGTRESTSCASAGIPS